MSAVAAAAIAGIVLVQVAGVVLHGAQAAAAPAAELSLHSTSAFPGGQLTVPIDLQIPGAESVHAIGFSIDIPDGMTFRSAALAYALETLEGSIAEVEPSGRVSQGTVRIRVRTREPMPPGVIAYLVLDVPGEPLRDELELVPRNVVASGPGGRVVAPVRTRSSHVSIVDPKSVPIPACFLYMH
jgi:hypothetical protein